MNVFAQLNCLGSAVDLLVQEECGPDLPESHEEPQEQVNTGCQNLMGWVILPEVDSLVQLLGKFSQVRGLVITGAGHHMSQRLPQLLPKKCFQLSVHVIISQIDSDGMERESCGDQIVQSIGQYRGRIIKTVRMYLDEGFDDNDDVQIQPVILTPINKNIRKYISEANSIIRHKPVTQTTRAIRGFVDYKLPSYLEFSSNIDRPSLEEQPLTKTQYKRYEVEEALEERYRHDNYSIREVYSRYRHKQEAYKYFSYAGRYISMNQIVNMQQEDCNELREMDLGSKEEVERMFGKGSMFASNFEGGNLYKAFEVGPDQFDLILENDTNTKGYNQWFFFMVMSFDRGSTVKLNVVNLVNKGSHFQKGMKPCIMSLQRYKSLNKTWYRGGSNVQYYHNNLKKDGDHYCGLSFSYTFEYSNDVVFFALGFPYSYSKLMRSIDTWRDDIPSLKRETLCTSISRNSFPVLRIGKSGNPTVVVLARQHPGETVGSYVLEGIIEGIKSMPVILDRFQFRIVPMLNIDGCVYGNFRTGLAGTDLNRKWTQPDKYFTPEVLAVSTMLQRYEKGDVKYFIDLHGHSTNLGTFIYSSSKGKTNRLFAYEMGEANIGFDRSECTFGIHISKEDTARAFIHYQLEGCKSITMETSLYGFMREGKIDDYYPSDLIKLGQDVVVCLMKLEAKDKKIISSLLFKSKAEDDSTGSEKDPGEDEIEEIQKDIKKIQKKFGIQTKKEKGRRRLLSCAGGATERNKMRSLNRLTAMEHEEVLPFVRPKSSLRISILQKSPIGMGLGKSLFNIPNTEKLTEGRKGSPLLRILKRKRADPKSSLLKLQRFSQR